MSPARASLLALGVAIMIASLLLLWVAFAPTGMQRAQFRLEPATIATPVR